MIKLLLALLLAAAPSCHRREAGEAGDGLWIANGEFPISF